MCSPSAAPSARLVEASPGHLRYEAAAVSLAALFRALESRKAALGVREYSVCQTSLEAVFLAFSRLQERADERRRAAAAATLRA